jgi:hypothetical protein
MANLDVHMMLSFFQEKAMSERYGVEGSGVQSMCMDARYITSEKVSERRKDEMTT